MLFGGLKQFAVLHFLRRNTGRNMRKLAFLPLSSALLRTRPQLHSQKAKRTEDARWTSVNPAPGNFQGNLGFSNFL